MTLYPFVYVMLTLPLSAGRMWSMAHRGQPISDPIAIAAAALLTSCGWVDSLLYTLTRKALLRDSMPGNSTSGRRSANDIWEATELGSKGITHTRTVTVEGGRVMETVPQSRSGARYHSPSGSIDPILTGSGKTETKVEVGIRRAPDSLETADDLDKVDDMSALPSYRQRWLKD